MQEDDEVNPRCPRVYFSESDIKSFYRSWSKALVVRVLESSFSFGAVKRRLEALWARQGNIQVSDISNTFYLVRFANPEDYKCAAFGGPWKIFDYYFSVARWTPDFNEEEPLKTILRWVRLPKLPIHFFNNLAVTRIGNYIGKTVRLDLATTEGARARYARVCVEVDLTKPLLGKYMIKDRTFFVEYESLENICVTCGFYDHKADRCTPDQAPDQPTAQAEENVSNEPDLEPNRTSDVGDWMVVQQRGKGWGRKDNQVSSKQPQSGSIYSALREEKVALPSQSVTGTVTGARPNKTQEIDRTTVDLAAKLVKALKQAPHMKENKEASTKVVGDHGTPRKPLIDMTNSIKGKGKVVRKLMHTKFYSLDRSGEIVIPNGLSASITQRKWNKLFGFLSFGFVKWFELIKLRKRFKSNKLVKQIGVFQIN
ncbi:hypothetical protein LINPERHAP2_LOCUS39739 [Linum perenne]